MARSVPSTYFETTKKGKSARASYVVNRDDVRVFEAGNGASLGKIEFGVFWASDQIRVRHFDGHGAAKLVIMGQIDQPESAFAQQLDDPVPADSFGQIWRRKIDRRGSYVVLEFPGRSQWMAVVHAWMRCCLRSLWHADLAALASILAMLSGTSTDFRVRQDSSWLAVLDTFSQAASRQLGRGRSPDGPRQRLPKSVKVRPSAFATLAIAQLPT